MLLMTVIGSVASALVWGLLGGVAAGAAVFLVGSTTGLLSMFAIQAVGLADPSVAMAVVLSIAMYLARPIVESYAGGAVMGYRAAGRTRLGRAFVAGTLGAAAAWSLWWGSLVLYAWSTPAAAVSLLAFGLGALAVGLAGMAGAQVASSTVLRRRPGCVGWAGSLVVVVTAAWIGITVLGPVLSGRTGLAPRVTREGIRAVSREEVEAILGPPMSSGVTPYRKGGTTLTYSRPVPFARWYPMLWVHLLDGRVVSVYGKRYIAWGIDDIGVYGLGAGTPWERTEFEATFER